MSLSLFENTELASLPAFATSLAIGLLMGLERERSPAANAGLRTFALTAMWGTLAAMLADLTHTPMLLGVALAGVAVAITSSYFLMRPQNRDPGTTTQIALLLCFGLGVLCWYDNRTLAVMLGICATLLLYFKSELSSMSRHMSRHDLLSILQFCALSFIILPILPNQDFGPYQAFNPYQTWMMVVLISGVGLAGFVSLRIFGERLSAPVLGILGGLASSTATTLTYARQAHDNRQLDRFASTIIVLANLTVFARLGIVGLLVAPAAARPLLTMMGAGLAAGLVVAGLQWRDEHEVITSPEICNPADLKIAFTFAALYSVVLFCAAWLSDIAGSRGLYLVAFASGLTDVDAISLSSMRLASQGRLDLPVMLMAIALAVTANTLFKQGLILSIGGWSFAKRCLPAMAASVTGMLVTVSLIAF